MSPIVTENTLSLPAVLPLTSPPPLWEEVQSLKERIHVNREMACHLVEKGLLAEPYTLHNGTLYTDPLHTRHLPITQKMYHALFHANLIDTKTELLEGVIVAKMSQDQPHARTLKRLTTWMMRQFDMDFIHGQSPILIVHGDGKTSEPEPDLFVLTNMFDSYELEPPPATDLLLCVEVADSTLYKDKVIKAPLYARAGITEYWIADTNSRTIIVHREPNNGKYESVVIYTAEQDISCLAKPDVLKKVDELIAPATNETITNTNL